MEYNLQSWQLALTRLVGAYAPNTIKAYYSDVSHFVDWCQRQNFTPFPATGPEMIDYLENSLAEYSFLTIKRRIYAIRKVTILLGCEDPTRTEEFNLAYRRIRRTKPHRPSQSKGINKGLLLRAIAAQPNTLVGIRNRALLSIGYDFLARRSEISSLQDADIEFLPDNAIRGIIRKSKTDQFGRGRLTFGSKRSTKLIKSWLKKKPEDIPWLFCAINHDRCLDRPLCDRSVNEIIKKSIVRVKGHKPRDWEISGHSLRIGAAQDLLIQGHETIAIMRAGGWRTISAINGYLQYAEHNVWS